MKDYPILKGVLRLFKEDSGLDNEQVFYFLDQAIDQGSIDLLDLRKELLYALENVNTDWKQIAEDTGLLVNHEDYESFEIADYVKEWLWEYLFPEVKLSESNILELRKSVLELLEAKRGIWSDAYDILHTLRLRSEFEKLEYYQLWLIDFKKNGIDRKEIRNKDRLIGLVRLIYPRPRL